MRQRTNNPNGRPIGVPNKVTANLKEKVNLLLENNFERIQSDLDSIEPKDRISVMLKLLDFVLPKPKLKEEERGVKLGLDTYEDVYV